MLKFHSHFDRQNNIFFLLSFYSVNLEILFYCKVNSPPIKLINRFSYNWTTKKKLFFFRIKKRRMKIMIFFGWLVGWLHHYWSLSKKKISFSLPLLFKVRQILIVRIILFLFFRIEIIEWVFLIGKLVQITEIFHKLKIISAWETFIVIGCKRIFFFILFHPGFDSFYVTKSIFTIVFINPFVKVYF